MARCVKHDWFGSSGGTYGVKVPPCPWCMQNKLRERIKELEAVKEFSAAAVNELQADNLALCRQVTKLEAENQRLRDEHFAVGEVREHNGSLLVIGALHPRIELDALPIGTKVYIKLGGGEE